MRLLCNLLFGSVLVLSTAAAYGQSSPDSDQNDTLREIKTVLLLMSNDLPDLPQYRSASSPTKQQLCQQYYVQFINHHNRLIALLDTASDIEEKIGPSLFVMQDYLRVGKETCISPFSHEKDLQRLETHTYLAKASVKISLSKLGN